MKWNNSFWYKWVYQTPQYINLKEIWIWGHKNHQNLNMKNEPNLEKENHLSQTWMFQFWIPLNFLSLVNQKTNPLEVRRWTELAKEIIFFQVPNLWVTYLREVMTSPDGKTKYHIEYIKWHVIWYNMIFISIGFSYCKGSSPFLFYRSQSCHLSHRKTKEQHPKCVYIYIIYLCLSHHLRYCIWSVCRQYLDVTGQLLDICVYVI